MPERVITAIGLTAGTSSGGIDVALERALRQVATFLGVDRGSLDIAGHPVRRISWALPGLEEPPRIMDGDQLPWAAERLGRGEIVRFSRREELPPAAAIDPPEDFAVFLPFC